MRPPGNVESVNVGIPRAVRAKTGLSGIDKRPVDGPVPVTVPALGGSGLEGDSVCDVANHGGPGQAVYAFLDAEADLDPEVRALALAGRGFDLEDDPST